MLFGERIVKVEYSPITFEYQFTTVSGLTKRIGAEVVYKSHFLQ